MIDLSRMLKEIEEVRKLLNILVLEKGGDAANPEVIGLSSHLDHLLVEYETLKGAHEERKGEPHASYQQR